LQNQADRQRLACLVSCNFASEYPDAAAVIDECLAFRLNMVRLRARRKISSAASRCRACSRPEWSASFDRALIYLHNVLTERKKLNA
jgi:hypothetical protein